MKPATPLAILEKARKIALNEGLNYVYIGNVPGSQASHTYCPDCKEIVVERKGYFIEQNNILNHRCKFCDYKIAGVWK